MHTLTEEYIDFLSHANNLSQANPHLFLGLHKSDQGSIIRLWRPGAQEVYIELLGEITPLNQMDSAGLFELEYPGDLTKTDYKVYHSDGTLTFDPYSMDPFLGMWDQYLFNRGVHNELYSIMGARVREHEGIKGVSFAVWAPNAIGVSLVGDFNCWDGRSMPMRQMGSSGVFEIFLPGFGKGMRYKFEIFTSSGNTLVKADPYALSAELRPNTASIVSDYSSYCWNDEEWLEIRKKQKIHSSPFNVYEVHLGSWKRDKGGEFLNYREIADSLAKYCIEMSYTHIELLPILEHPLDESWGYQVTGFFAPTSRFGSMQDFQYFVDHLHQQGIGVLLDFVPAHFPSDDFSLARFDGTALYEHKDPRLGYHPHWHTLIFNYSQNEVSNFLIASALFWLKEMHIDGLRVDAVASMLYLDFGREEGQWIPNWEGGTENHAAIKFLKQFNSVLHSQVPGIVTIAEESTCFPQVSHQIDAGGLGFDFKWNMGWMNDTLQYFQTDPFKRSHHSNKLTFGMLYAYTENFVSVLSHDEVVHGKKSLYSKMPGQAEKKFAHLRLLISYMTCYPGKKLLFMGGEFGVQNEWWSQKEIDWDLLEEKENSSLHKMVKDLNRLYLENGYFWEWDALSKGFEWVSCDDLENCTFAYKRIGSKSQVVCVHNFSGNSHLEYQIKLGEAGIVKKIFSTDSREYGGAGLSNKALKVENGATRIEDTFNIVLPPFSTQIFAITT